MGITSYVLLWRGTRPEIITSITTRSSCLTKPGNEGMLFHSTMSLMTFYAQNIPDHDLLIVLKYPTFWLICCKYPSKAAGENV